MSFISDARKEVRKIVNGKPIYRAKGTKGVFYVDVTPNKYAQFRTIKEAEKYIKNNLF